MAENTVSASAVVDATPADVFDFIRRPANHAEISGTDTVKGSRQGPDALSMGDEFGMDMKIVIPYRVSSKVVEFEQDRLIAWCHAGGHRWRWEVEPTDDGKTRVTETFDLSTARVPFALRVMGFPKRHEPNVRQSVENVADHFASRIG